MKSINGYIYFIRACSYKAKVVVAGACLQVLGVNEWESLGA